MLHDYFLTEALRAAPTYVKNIPLDKMEAVYFRGEK